MKIKKQRCVTFGGMKTKGVKVTLSLWNHDREACFNPYRALCSLHSKCGDLDTNPGGWVM